MQNIKNPKWSVTLFFLFLSLQTLFAQTKSDIFYENVPVTWLGIDFSQAKFVGSEAAYKASGQLVNSEFAEKYASAWNNLFITEPKKYDVARAIHRPSVAYALDVTEKANKAINKNFFTEREEDFKTLTEQNISDLIKQYDFQGKTGIGMMFFVEGMSKGQEEEGVWVVFMDMNSKTVLLTSYQTGKPGGFGFRNYWAKPFYTILKSMASDFDQWKKSTLKNEKKS